MAAASSCSSLMDSAATAAAAATRHHAYSRKEKSLGLLCSNFVSLYNRDGVESVGLDDAAKRLGVERRRIYDIVNVLESVGVLARKAKNRYSWIGFSGIPRALEELKAEALRETTCPNIARLCTKDYYDDEDDRSIDQNEDIVEEKPNKTTLKGRSVSDNRKEKSLGLLTRNFVKLLLTTTAETVSLDEAARLLLGDGHDASIMRTKVRRLYDIANVLSSMNLIEKTQQADTRKPAFRWVGNKAKKDNGVAMAIPLNAKQWNKRSFGTDITNVDSKRTKFSSTSVDWKPSEVQVPVDELKECNLTAQKQIHGSKGYVFGPFCPAEVTKCGGKEKAEKKNQDWETLASFKPQYHNQALSELFAHYMDAWKSWYVEVAQGSNSSQQPYQSIVNQLS